MNVWAPDASLQTSPCPLLVVLPGACSTHSTVDWSGPSLAAAGYVVATLDVNSGNDVQICVANAATAINALLTSANPYLSSTDTSRIVLAGWSLGGRALVKLQEIDTRIDAIAVWDNLAVSEDGDEGSPACTNVPGVIRTPRVPALGLASDFCSTTAGKTAESKKVGYEWWKTNGQPTMQVNFAGWSHYDFGQSGSATKHAQILYYTIPWFDRFVKNDSTADATLLARTVTGVPVSTLLSSVFKSAAAFDGVDCPDFKTSCP